MSVRITGLAVMLSGLLVGATFAATPALDGRGGILDTDTGVYGFDPTMCGMALEDGQHDIEVYGPGTAPDGRVVFVEFSSTGRYLSVGFDIASVFHSADEALVARDFDIAVSGTTITASDLVFSDLNGTPMGTGTLVIDCRSA